VDGLFKFMNGWMKSSLVETLAYSELKRQEESTQIVSKDGRELSIIL
jgi:hypothetical protein